MELLETITIQVHNGYFVDLFVRKSNTTAINMYMKVSASAHICKIEIRIVSICWLFKACYLLVQMGYIVYRRVIGYYTGSEDALDMRKSMPRDSDQHSMVPLKHPIYPHQLEHD